MFGLFKRNSNPKPERKFISPIEQLVLNYNGEKVRYEANAIFLDNDIRGKLCVTDNFLVFATLKSVFLNIPLINIQDSDAFIGNTGDYQVWGTRISQVRVPMFGMKTKYKSFVWKSDSAGKILVNVRSHIKSARDRYRDAQTQYTEQTNGVSPITWQIVGVRQAIVIVDHSYALFLDYIPNGETTGKPRFNKDTNITLRWIQKEEHPRESKGEWVLSLVFPVKSGDFFRERFEDLTENEYDKNIKSMHEIVLEKLLDREKNMNK